MLKISPLKRALYLQASLIPKFFRDDTPGIPIKKEEGQKGKSERGEKERGLRHGCRRGMDAPWHRSLNHIRTGGRTVGTDNCVGVRKISEKGYSEVCTSFLDVCIARVVCIVIASGFAQKWARELESIFPSKTSGSAQFFYFLYAIFAYGLNQYSLCRLGPYKSQDRISIMRKIKSPAYLWTLFFSLVSVFLHV